MAPLARACGPPRAPRPAALPSGRPGIGGRGAGCRALPGHHTPTPPGTAPGGGGAGPKLRASRIPTPDEDREVAHSAYLSAFSMSQPEAARLPGMQEFAAAILSRARIPSQQYADPLQHVFDEWDADGDGALSAAEVGGALRSRGVRITDEQAAAFIAAVDLNDSHKVERGEWRDLVLHMAAADLHSRKEGHRAQEDGEWVTCSFEQDEEIQEKLKSWIDTLMMRKYA